MGLPGHVGFIMDGNGRWAEGKGLARVRGHEAGAETVRRVVTFACRRGIRHVTLYAFSTENWARPKDEVAALMLLFGQFIESELGLMLDKGVKLRIIGDRERLSSDLRQKIAYAEKSTAQGTTCTLIIAINYGGRDEILRAARQAIGKIQESGGGVESLDEEIFSSCLDTAGIPDPDLIIRTAGEMRLSNFLVWQGAYSELYFPACTWPEFSDDDFEAALSEYRTRCRKFGGLSTDIC